jgi:transcriptional regulator with XRE-family HTH domain
MMIYNINKKRGDAKLKDRLKQLRKTLGLTQQAFADKLGVKRNTVGQWECGINPLTDQTIFSICREFDVNKEWLCTGEGEMFVIRSDEEEIAAFLGDVLSEEGETYKKQLILALANLSDEGWRGIKEFLDALIAEKKERGEL